MGWTHTWKKDGFNFSSVSVFHRSTKGRKGEEEHICLVFKTICTYNLAFKHVHGSLIRLFVSFDKNTPNCPEQDIFVCGEYVVVCVCAFQTEAPTANVVVYKTTCTRVLFNSHRTPFPNNWCPNQHTSLCAYTHNQRLLPAVLC